ncbi:MAG: peptide/nickel transport system substrate-binding protein [Thermomicrobiales bacterium]|nr:peptide/nickel transport system substrate-binding protein [Thermomicrobiales bacterium]
MNQQEILDVLSAKLRSGAITRRQFIQAAAFFGLGAGVKPLTADASSAPRGGASRLTAQAEGEVRFLVAEAFTETWDPYQHTIQIQRRIENQIFDPLVRIETNDFSVYAPALAESWTQIDELTTEFKLRQGVTFHNGQPFSAADVKASIELASGATNTTTVSASRFVPTTVEVVDETTVRLTTKTPFAPFLNELSVLPILSAADITAGPETLKAAPNGTGAFKLTGNDKDKKTMTANASYWGGAPQIGTLSWEYIIDSQTRLSAFLAKQAHALDRVPPEHVPTLQGSDDVALISTTGFENVNLWMRQDAAAPWDGANVKLREAVMWSIDREALVKSLVLGASEVAVTHIPNHAVFAKPQEPAYTYDLEKAKAALAEAGFPDGGVELPLWGVTGFLPRGPEVAQAIADSLEKTGFKVTLQVTDVAAIIDGLFSDAKPGVFFHLSWSSNGDPHGALSTLYHSPGAWVGSSDEQIDALLEKGASTTNVEERAKVYEELQAYLWKNLVHIPLYNSDFTVAHLKTLTGVVALPNFMTDFRKASLAG